MSLITRCPTCETLFRVVPDQLRVSDGWVRCGQCEEIFEASLHLVALPQAEQMPVARPEDQGASIEVSDCAVSSCESTEMRPDSDSTDATGTQDGTTERCAELSDFSFLHQNTSKAIWRKPLMRVALVLLGMALLLGLTGQVIWHERDRIVASLPGLKPWLLVFCKPLSCTLSPLQKIESIVIDSASFSKIRGDAYRLNFTLKNTSATALALPAIELTLTDLSDQPVIRRVYLAIELGINADTLAANSERAMSLTLAVMVADLADRIVGYRLLAFYP